MLARSQQICLTRYEKELFSETSYLEAYERYRTPLNPQQLAVFAGLYAWRDRMCRLEDESAGYVLPRGQLLRLAQSMPGASGVLLVVILFIGFL